MKVTVALNRTTMSILSSGHFILCIPLNKVSFNAVKLILADSFQKLTILFYEKYKLQENQGKVILSRAKDKIDSVLKGGNA